MDANRTLPGYQLKDELARYCLPPANRDPNRKLAWVNSICILFLLIGILGAQSLFIPIKPVPPVEKVVATVIEPLPPPPSSSEQQNPKPEDQQKQETPQVVVVTPEAPDITFSVPTIGNLVAPAGLAQAPPLNPSLAPAPLQSVPLAIGNTGAGGERPQPPYPQIALEQGEQGRVTLSIDSDGQGNITAIQVKESSGFPVLDRSAMDFVRRHWRLPQGSGNRLFEATITYKITIN